jgi:hypothetical protein
MQSSAQREGKMYDTAWKVGLAVAIVGLIRVFYRKLLPHPADNDPSLEKPTLAERLQRRRKI